MNTSLKINKLLEILSFSRNFRKGPSYFTFNNRRESIYQKALEDCKKASEIMKQLTESYKSYPRSKFDPCLTRFGSSCSGDWCHQFVNSKMNEKAAAGDGGSSKKFNPPQLLEDKCKKESSKVDVNEDKSVCKKISFNCNNKQNSGTGGKKNPCICPPKKGESDKKEDSNKEKSDPCKKKKGDVGKKDGSNKEDPCKKKKGDDRKKDGSNKKKEDPSKKDKGDGSKKDGSKKTDDPCKKNKGGGAGKQNNTGIKSDDPCKKQKDSSKSNSKKDDPSKPKSKNKFSKLPHSLPLSTANEIKEKLQEEPDIHDILDELDVIDKEKLMLAEEYYGDNYQGKTMYGYNKYSFHDVHVFLRPYRAPAPNAHPEKVGEEPDE